jgi:hypothetical protein
MVELCSTKTYHLSLISSNQFQLKKPPPGSSYGKVVAAVLEFIGGKFAKQQVTIKHRHVYDFCVLLYTFV